MTIESLYKELSALGIPFARCEFSRPTPAPCMVYLPLDGGSVCADSENVFGCLSVRLELYLKPDNRRLPGMVENILRKNKLTYQREITWVSERKEILYVYELGNIKEE